MDGNISRDAAINAVMHACEDDPDKAVRAICDLPVLDYGPVTRAIPVEELQTIMAALTWVDGFYRGTTGNEPSPLLQFAMNKLSEWTRTPKF